MQQQYYYHVTSVSRPLGVRVLSARVYWWGLHEGLSVIMYLAMGSFQKLIKAHCILAPLVEWVCYITLRIDRLVVSLLKSIGLRLICYYRSTTTYKAVEQQFLCLCVCIHTHMCFEAFLAIDFWEPACRINCFGIYVFQKPQAHTNIYHPSSSISEQKTLQQFILAGQRQNPKSAGWYYGSTCDFEGIILLCGLISSVFRGGRTHKHTYFNLCS